MLDEEFWKYLDEIDNEGLESVIEYAKMLMSHKDELFVLLCKTKSNDNILFYIEKPRNIHKRKWDEYTGKILTKVKEFYMMDDDFGNNSAYCKKIYVSIDDIDHISELPSIDNSYEYSYKYYEDPEEIIDEVCEYIMI